MDMLALSAALCVAGFISAGLYYVYQANASPRQGLDRRLGTVLGSGSPYDLPLAQAHALRPSRTGRLPVISSLIEGRGWTEGTALRLERADLRFTVSEYVALRLFLALIAGIVPLVVLSGTVLAYGAMAVCAVVAFKLPEMYIGFAIKRRVAKLNEQLIEGLSMISNSLKAGFGLMQALDLASRELTHPIATELRRTLQEINVGSSTEEALNNMARRSGSDDLDIVITAMLVQQSTGGNLAEILDNVAHTMRERIRIRGEIKTLTTQQMMTGFIIGGLPFVMVALFQLMSPEYMRPLFTEPIGLVMLAGAGMLEFFGIVLIKRILAIEV